MDAPPAPPEPPAKPSPPRPRRPIPLRRKLVYALIPLLALLGLGEVVAWLALPAFTERLPRLPFVHMEPRDDESDLLAVESDYFAFDAHTGVRFKPLTPVFSHEADEQGRPRMPRGVTLFTDAFGFVPNHNDLSQQRDYRAIAADARTFRILVSGGSTTAGWGASSPAQTWPAQLERLLNERDNALLERFDRVVVINQGVFGFGVTQEIARFAVETQHLRPHLVVSFNGINERFTYRAGNPVDYGISSHQRRMERLLNGEERPRLPAMLPNLAQAAYVLAGRWDAPPLARLYGHRRPDYLQLDALTLYHARIRQYRALANAAGAAFVHVLQPDMAVGDKTLTPEEARTQRFFGSATYPVPWDDYRALIRDFYARFRPRSQDVGSIDLSDVFDDESASVYADPRHYNDRGQAILAQRLFDVITSSARRAFAAPSASPSADEPSVDAPGR